jgi:xanthine dehydrogenase accessory factor
MGYVVVLIDPSAEAADFPDADAVLTDAAAAGASVGGAPSISCCPRYAVVATQGQWDEEATVAALALDPPPAYLGVMASGKRFGEMRALLAGTAGEAAFARIKNPAGLDLGATLPEEIAISILAEIVARQRAAARANAAASTETAASPAAVVAASDAPTRRIRLSQVVAQGAPDSAGAAGGARAGEQARDPVCGMTVTVAGAAHRAEHDGRAYFFCCGGCRARFLAAPAQFLGAEGSR